jgi:hypothetical protein
MAELRVE